MIQQWHDKGVSLRKQGHTHTVSLMQSGWNRVQPLSSSYKATVSALSDFQFWTCSSSPTCTTCRQGKQQQQQQKYRYVPSTSKHAGWLNLYVEHLNYKQINSISVETHQTEVAQLPRNCRCPNFLWCFESVCWWGLCETVESSRTSV